MGFFLLYSLLAASPLAACSPRYIWIVDPPYSRLRRSVIGLPCKIEMVREKERQRERERERERDRERERETDEERMREKRESVRERDKDRGRHIWIVNPPYSRLRRSVIGLPCKIEMVREKERQVE